MNRLTTFLNSPRAKAQGGSYTHTSMAGGKYYVHCEHQEQFFELYKAAVAEGKRVPSLIEKHKDFSPALIDFDLRFPVGETARKYTLEHVKTFMRKYLEVLGQFVDLSQVEAPDVVLMEKPTPRQEKGVTKDGFHIVLPTVVTRPSVQYLVRDACMEAVEEFRSAVGCVNNADDIFDKSVVHTAG